MCMVITFWMEIKEGKNVLAAKSTGIYSAKVIEFTVGYMQLIGILIINVS